MNKEVSVRFAPSPTGPLHIGGVRTALYNYLFARHFGGNFILRIEDTDQSRFVKGAEDYIKESLSWLNILPDEGIDNRGPHKPYRQSERKDIYKKYAELLLDKKLAYYAFDSSEDLENMRNRLKSEGINMPQYNSHTRGSMLNSLTLSTDEVKKKIEAGDKYVIRLLVPENEQIEFRDLIRGEISVASDTIDDKVLLKSDGLPTYHLANVVDDHLMGITHVIRGEEWLPSAPLHILLYQFLGWEKSIPEFAHLPLILKPEGSGKLSKRDGDKHGFPVFPIDWIDPSSGDKSIGFRENGYLPETMVNFLAFLGWNPGTEQELFSIDDLIREFSIERVNKAGAKFDIEKAKWYNQQYIKLIPDFDIGAYLHDNLAEKGIKADLDYVTRVAIAFKERITFLHELYEISSYFFFRPETYDEKVIRKKWTSINVDFLTKYAAELNKEYEKFDGNLAKNIMQPILDELGIGMGSVMQVLRVAITGVTSGIDLIYTIELLGNREVGKRIEIALERMDDFVK